MTLHERVHFLTLTPDAQAAAIRRLAAAGYGDHAIAAITGWHVEAVRRVLAGGDVWRTWECSMH